MRTFKIDFLRKPTRRDLRGAKLVISDAHEGIKATVARVFSASWQRYRVHFMRNALAHAGKTQRRWCPSNANSSQRTCRKPKPDRPLGHDGAPLGQAAERLCLKMSRPKRWRSGLKGLWTVACTEVNFWIIFILRNFSIALSRQGSGKSLTMVFLALKLKPHLTLDATTLQNPNILVLTDRIDLDDQISKTFVACGLPNPKQAASVGELREAVARGGKAEPMRDWKRFSMLMTFLRDTGCRLGEALNLTIADLRESQEGQQRAVVYAEFARYTTKNKKPRSVPLSP